LIVAVTEQAPQERLCEEILADGRRQAERLLRRARQEAQRLAEATAAEAARFREETLARARQRADQQARMHLAKVPVEQKRLRAAHVERLLDAIRQEALQELAPARTRLARADLLPLIARAAAGLAGDRLVLRLSPADRETLAGSFIDDLRSQAGKPELHVEWGEPLPDGASGPLLQDEAGLQEWDNRLTSRLSRLWPALRRTLAAATGLVGEAPTESAS
jgi:vacuolar-type H+-ATPase subunit E/Vma4